MVPDSVGAAQILLHPTETESGCISHPGESTPSLLGSSASFEALVGPQPFPCLALAR